MSAPRLLLVVPAYNEAGRLDREAFLAFVDRHPGVAIHFVDDGSRDGTEAMLDALAASRPGRISATRLPTNAGKAEAVRQGMLHGLATGATLVGFADADLATPLDEALSLAAALDADPALWAAIGSRVQLLGRDIARSALRHYLGRVFATAASLVLRLPVYDTQCGLKLFRNVPAVTAAFARPFTSRWIFDVEILARLEVAHGGPVGLPVREVPLEAWHDRSGSRLRVADFVRAPGDLLRIRRAMRR